MSKTFRIDGLHNKTGVWIILFMDLSEDEANRILAVGYRRIFALTSTYSAIECLDDPRLSKIVNWKHFSAINKVPQW